MMKIKIISDGTSFGTKIINIDTGEELDSVIKIQWNYEASNIAEAIITFEETPVELIGKTK